MASTIILLQARFVGAGQNQEVRPAARHASLIGQSAILCSVADDHFGRQIALICHIRIPRSETMAQSLRDGQSQDGFDEIEGLSMERRANGVFDHEP